MSAADTPETAELAAYEALRLNGLVRNWSAVAALVLAYSMNWMDLVGQTVDVARVPASEIAMSEAISGRQSFVFKPGDMVIFGIPLHVAFGALLLAAIIRVVYPAKRPLHPFIPMAVAGIGTVMACGVLWRTVAADTAGFLTSGFYVALAAFVLNTLFDLTEYADWRSLKKRPPMTP